jgi:hypothetical protein
MTAAEAAEAIGAVRIKYTGSRSPIPVNTGSQVVQAKTDDVLMCSELAAKALLEMPYFQEA